MNFAAFDIEISNTNIPPGKHRDLFKFGPLEYAIGAVLVEGGECEFYENPHQLLGRLVQLSRKGVDIVTSNGLKFDFRVLAYATDNKTTCARLAWNHYDIIFQAFCLLGHPLSLNVISKGMGLGGKVYSTTNNAGEIIQIHARLVPELWCKGEKKAVSSYLAGDVDQLLRVATSLRTRSSLVWASRKGRPMSKSLVDGMRIAKRCLEYREPYNGWMESPLQREDFYEWTL